MFVLKSLFIVLLFFSQINNLEASSFFSRFLPTKTQASPKKPAQYYVSQQVGATCFLSCWLNFDELQRIRAGHKGQILNEQGQFEASAVARNRLDWFLATTQPIASWYHIFQAQKRMVGTPFANFVARAADDSKTINSSDIQPSYLSSQSVLNKEAIKSFWPHLLSKDSDHQGANFLYLPLIEASEKFYWGAEKIEIQRAEAAASPTTTEDTIAIVAFMPAQTATEPRAEVHMSVPSAWTASYGFNGIIYCSGFKNLGHTMFSSPCQLVDYNPNSPDERKSWYNFGLYKLVLMAAGIDRNNDKITTTSAQTLTGAGASSLEVLPKSSDAAVASSSTREHEEILQFNTAINATPNPWQNIDQKRDSFIEYRIADLFKIDAALKSQAIAVVDVFFKTFGFYTDAKNLGLSDKMQDLPGEDQMLAYCFVQSLRNLSAGSISADALQAVLEFESKEVNLFRAYLFFTERTTSLPAYCHKKYYEEKVTPDSNKTNFHRVWQDIKRRLALPDGTDMVSFSGHGAVLSFDSRALRAQHFEDRGMANDLGFVTIDSSFAKGLKPFYMVGDEEK